LIGCGDIAQRNVGPAIKALNRGVLSAVCRIDMEQLKRCGARLGVEDSATVVMQFVSGATGAITVIRGGRLDVDTVAIYGTQGNIDIPSLNQGRVIINSGRGRKEETHAPHPNGHFPLIDSFTDCLLQNKAPVVDGAVGLQVQSTIDRVYELGRWCGD
jgi:predicted dehydrogenase